MRQGLVRLLAAVAVAAALIALSPDAQAQSRFTLSLKGAWGMPVGDVATLAGSTGALGELFSAAIPITAAAAWRPVPQLSVGVYGQFGVAHLASEADASFPDGKGRDHRVGVEATWKLSPIAAVTPWAGVAAGWEWASVSWKESGMEVSTTFSGPDAGVEAGGEWQVSEAFALGPFLGLSVGQFRTIALDGGSFSSTRDIGSSDRELHGWLQLGLRGRLDL